jgi:hypothetical protein
MSVVTRAYLFQLGTTPPKEIVHTLEVMEPPKIIYIQPNTRLEVAKGSSIKMECRASGNPKPRTIWSRKVSFLCFNVDLFVLPTSCAYAPKLKRFSKFKIFSIRFIKMFYSLAIAQKGNIQGFTGCCDRIGNCG